MTHKHTHTHTKSFPNFNQKMTFLLIVRNGMTHQTMDFSVLVLDKNLLSRKFVTVVSNQFSVLHFENNPSFLILFLFITITER